MNWAAQKLVFTIIVFSCTGICDAALWLRWDCNQLPENYLQGTVLASSGSSGREIFQISGSNYGYRCTANSGNEGNLITTTQNNWKDCNSTIVFRQKIVSYNAGAQKAVSLMIKSGTQNWICGFIWSRVDSNDRIQTLEDANKYIVFPNLGTFCTYRVIYDSSKRNCSIYAIDECRKIARFLLSSSGYGCGLDKDELSIGDQSSIFASTYEIDYVSWTNDGIPERKYSMLESNIYYYRADSGKKPENTEPAWTNYCYTDSTSSLLMDAITSEPVLVLDNTNSIAPYTYASYQIGDESGAGTDHDLITFQMRFRLLDVSQKDQLGLWIIRPPNAKQSWAGELEHIYHFRLNCNGINVQNGTQLTQFAKPLLNNWHVLKLVIDVEKANASIFIDENSMPIATFAGVSGSTTSPRNMIIVGDGSGTITGRAAISYIKWSRDMLEIPLQGGKIQIIEKKINAEKALASDHLNFPKVMLWQDGTLWLHYAIGDHKDPSTQTTGQLISCDGGISWTVPGFWVMGYNVYQFENGQIIGFGIDGSEEKQVQTGTIFHWNSPTSYGLPQTVNIQLPWPATIFPERRIMKDSNGDFLISAFAKKTGETKFRTVILISRDRGLNWSYLSTVAFSEDAGPEGYNEPVLVRLCDDSILCLMRTGSIAPLFQSRSIDGGVTWSEPVQIAENGVFPDAMVLSDGTLVASSGRPGIYLLVDYTGTGNNWQRINLYEGGPFPYPSRNYDDAIGCSYTSLTEVLPNVLMLTFTESGFAGYNLPEYNLPNKISSIYIKVEKDNPADINKDLLINGLDFSVLARGWSVYETSADIGPLPYGKDGKIDFSDLMIFMQNWLFKEQQ